MATKREDFFSLNRVKDRINDFRAKAGSLAIIKCRIRNSEYGLLPEVGVLVIECRFDFLVGECLAEFKDKLVFVEYPAACRHDRLIAGIVIWAFLKS